MSNNILILQAFEKARQEEVKKGNLKPSKVDKSNALAMAIADINGFNIGERRLRDYYNEAKEEELSIPQSKVIEALVEYLGFPNYQAFEESLISHDNIESKKIQKSDKISFKSRNLISIKGVILAISLLGIVIFMVMNLMNEKKRWMIWKNDRYEEVNFSAVQLKKGRLKLYDLEKIENFRKVDTSCDYLFFNPDGSVTVWYAKNNSGTLELFSSLGLHPETGKTLKPITEYMIKKYICPEKIE